MEKFQRQQDAGCFFHGGGLLAGEKCSVVTAATPRSKRLFSRRQGHQAGDRFTCAGA